MRRLPSLRFGKCLCRLPLADHAADALLNVLLAESNPHRLELLTDHLRQDPSLVLWAMCRDATTGSSVPKTIREVAQRLADHLPSKLGELRQIDSGKSDEPPQLTKQQAVQYAELAAESITAAQRLSTTSPHEEDPLYLLGLLHNALEWLNSSCKEKTDLSADCLPGWFATLPKIDSVQQRSINKSAPVEVVEEDVEDRYQEIQDRWLAEDEQAAGRLANLVEKLLKLETLETEFQETLQTEKLDAMKELAYGASHEINNPLANISTRAQLLIKDEKDPERRRKLAAINAQAMRAYEMIADMMLFARPPRLAPESMDLVALIHSLVAELEPIATDRSTTLNCNGASGPLVITADAAQLSVALRAMCINSLEALGGGGQIEITVRPAPQDTDSAPGKAVQIIVYDDGPGIDPEVRRHLFDPFYSGREAGRGLGFGLSKCWRIITNHGGRIDVESQPGHGATFTITLPVEPSS